MLRSPAVDWRASKEIAETVESILKSAGILVAAGWAYWRFFLQAERETSISSKLQVTVLACTHSDYRLIEVRSTLANNGKVPCQIDMSHSSLRVAHVVFDVNNGTVSWRTETYFEKPSLGSLLNVPVGASMDEVQFVPVPHPGVYQISTFFAQTERDTRRLYARIGQPLPADYRDNPSGWPNASIVSTLTTGAVSTEGPSPVTVERDGAGTAHSV